MNPTRARPAKNGETATPRARPRVRASVRDGEDTSDPRDQQYDLLTAALLGAAIGAGTTLLLRRGPSGRRPIGPAWSAARTGARMGARWARRGAREAVEQGRDLWERIPRDEIEDRLRDYAANARDAIDHLVEHELKDLRKAIRRRRKRLGL